MYVIDKVLKGKIKGYLKNNWDIISFNQKKIHLKDLKYLFGNFIIYTI